MSTSKITNSEVLACITKMRETSKERKFQQTVELQIGLKDYDPQKDKRFSGTVRLPNIPRPKPSPLCSPPPPSMQGWQGW